MTNVRKTDFYFINKDSETAVWIISKLLSVNVQQHPPRNMSIIPEIQLTEMPEKTVCLFSLKTR